MKLNITKYFIRLAMVVGLLCFSSSALWGEPVTTTVTAAKITSSSASWTGSRGEVWSVSVNGGVTNQNVTNSYAQVGTSSSPSTSITYSTSGINGTITSVVVNCAAYQGKATISATVGGNAFGTQGQSVPSWSSNTGGDVTFSGSSSGAIEIIMTNGSGGKAMYIKSITVTYASGPTTYTMTYDANGGTGTITDSDSPYISGSTVTVKANSFTRAGFIFTKWNTAANGSGTDFDAGETFKINANTTLYAQWASTTVPTTTTIDATGITNTDVYINTSAGSLSAAVKDNNNSIIPSANVTWSGNNDDVATIDANTGEVTLVAPGEVTFTANYAGVTYIYESSFSTYQMTVTSSAPYVQPTKFDIYLNNSLFGTSYSGSVSEITDANPIDGASNNVNVTYAGSGNHYVNDNQIRFYPNNKLTFEAPSGYVIKSVMFTSDGTWAATIAANSGTYVSSNKTWTGSATSVLFTGSGSSRCDISKATIEIKVPAPEITAQDVGIECDATDGGIAYSISNEPTPVGTISAELISGNWLTLGNSVDSPIPFTCTTNTAYSARIATVRLTYTYGDNETVTKDISITQDAAPQPVINANNVEIEYDATSGEVSYSIDNPAVGVVLTASSTSDWISNIIVGSNKVTFTVTENTGSIDRVGTISLCYTGADDKQITVTQKYLVVDYAALPFQWSGGSSEDFKALNGCSASALSSDYASQNAPYLIKFDNDGKYLQVKTDGRPGFVTVAVKMIGGSNDSSITVQESAEGETFTDVQILNISGSQNDVLTLKTTKDFKAVSRYVRLYFTKGSNVGVGPITIEKYVPSTINLTGTSADGHYWATFYSSVARYSLSSGAEAYTMNAAHKLYRLGTDGNVVPKNEAVIIISDTPEITLSIDSSETPVAVNGTTNILKGSDTPVSVFDGTPYVLGINGEKLGFYQYNGTPIPENKAYYVVEQ